MSRSKLAGLGAPLVLARPHDGVAVADARRHPEQHRDLPALRHLDGRQHEIIRLLRVGRLQHRQPGRHRVTPVVLFVLARGHARVVGGDDDQRAAHAGVSGREQRVGGHVQADVFHRAQRPRPAEGRADGRPPAPPSRSGTIGHGRPARRNAPGFPWTACRGSRPRARRPRAAPPARWLRRRLTEVCLTHSFDKMRGSLIPPSCGVWKTNSAAGASAPWPHRPSAPILAAPNIHLGAHWPRPSFPLLQGEGTPFEGSEQLTAWRAWGMISPWGEGWLCAAPGHIFGGETLTPAGVDATLRQPLEAAFKPARGCYGIQSAKARSRGILHDLQG